MSEDITVYQSVRDSIWSLQIGVETNLILDRTKDIIRVLLFRRRKWKLFHDFKVIALFSIPVHYSLENVSMEVFLYKRLKIQDYPSLGVM